MAKKRKYTSHGKLSSAELKEFRAKVAALKKAGKLPASRSKTNPRTARPSMKRGGKTLAEIVNKTRLPKKPPLAPLGKALSIRDFPTKHKSLAGVLKDLEEHGDEINALKRPDENFAFQIDGIRSYAVFGSIQQFARSLAESAGIQQVLKKRQDSQELYNSLKIVRWNKTAKEWKPKAQKRKSSHAARQAKSRRKK